MRLLFICVVNFQIGDAAVERTAFLQWEDQCTYVFHRIFSTIVEAFLGVQLFHYFVVNEQAGRRIVTADADSRIFAFSYTVVESVQISVACKAEHTADRV